MLSSLRRITISDYYCSHTIVTILLAAPFLYQVQTCSFDLVWAMRTSPTVVIQPDCWPAQPSCSNVDGPCTKENRGRELDVIKIAWKGGTMQIEQFSSSKLQKIGQLVLLGYVPRSNMTYPESAKSGRWIIANIYVHFCKTHSDMGNVKLGYVPK